MTKYRVTFVITSIAYVTVDAEDEFDALAKAKKVNTYDDPPEVQEAKADYAEEVEDA